MVNSILDFIIACYNTSVQDMLTLEQDCYKNNSISFDAFKRLIAAKDDINFYVDYIERVYGISTKPSVLPLPKELNAFTKVAYLSSLKEKYGLTYT